MPHMESVGLAEAKDQLSALTARANREGRPFVILKNNKPWVEVRPIAKQPASTPHVVAAKRTISPASLDELFAGYEGEFQAHEDGLSCAVGHEEL